MRTPRLAAALAFVLPVIVSGQLRAPLSPRPELARLDRLLGAGDTAAASALLEQLAPDLGKDDRLAFDTIYVLIGRGRFAEAKDQWNRLAPRLQQRPRTTRGTPSQPGGDAPPPWLPEALFTQGLLAARGGGDKADTLKLLRQADGLGFPPLDSPLMRLAADCLLELGEFDLAASAYREIVKRAPVNAETRLALANALYSGGKIVPARKEAEEVLRLAPETPRAHYTLAAVLFEQHQYDEARVHLERELARDPRCTPCLSRLARIAYLAGNDKACESWLSKTMPLDPTDVETRLVAGMLALRRGQYDAAIQHLSLVVERSPDFPTGRFQLATAYRRAGNADKAREQLEVYQRLLKEQKAREIGFRGER